MPYKNPERKRQWEREHREERNARRRQHQTAPIARPAVPKPVSDLVSTQNTISTWAVIGGFALADGIVVLAALGGASGLGYGGSATGRKA